MEEKVVTKSSSEKKLNLKLVLLIGAGVTLLLLFVANMGLIESQFKNILFSYYPELRPIDRLFTRYYPGYKLDYSSVKSTFYGKSGSETTNILTVNLSSTRELPPRAEYGRAGRLVCNILKKEEKHYDLVKISFQKRYGILGFAPFHYTMSYNRSCESWFDKKNDQS